MESLGTSGGQQLQPTLTVTTTDRRLAAVRVSGRDRVDAGRDAADRLLLHLPDRHLQQPRHRRGGADQDARALPPPQVRRALVVCLLPSLPCVG